MKDEVNDLVQRLDGMTFNHSTHVREIARNYEKSVMGDIDKSLSTAAFLHDVGKVYIPFCIIDKPSSLTKLERQVIDLHPYLGYQMLKEFEVDEEICRTVLYHHSFNPPVLEDIGTYRNSKIDEMAVMLKTIDIYEALITARPYRRGFSKRKALKILESESENKLLSADILKFLNEYDE